MRFIRHSMTRIPLHYSALHVSKAEPAHMPDADSTFEARVVESFGRRVALERSDGSCLPANLFGKRLEIVCGDRVRATSRAGECHVIELLPRATLFCRMDSRGR